MDDLSWIRQAADLLSTSALVVLFVYGIYTERIIIGKTHKNLVEAERSKFEAVEIQYKERLKEYQISTELIRIDRDQWRNMANVSRELIERTIGVAQTGRSK